MADKSFGKYVTALRPAGMLSLLGAVGGSDVSFDAYQLLQVTLTGYASDTSDGAALRHAIRSISGWVSRGVIQAPVRRVFPLGKPQQLMPSWNNISFKAEYFWSLVIRAR